jgi:phage-related minor tail protein
VFNQPTAFKFGRGGSNLGIMGEAGPEAIMPLKRTAGGKLGVVAQGAGGGGVTNIHVTTNVMTDGTAQTSVTATGDQAAAYANFTNEMRAIAQEAINRAQQPGGSLWRAGAGVPV